MTHPDDDGLAPVTELVELAAERAEILAQLTAAHDQLRDADEALRSVMTTRDEAFQREADLLTRWEASDVQLRHLRLALENAARERDELMLRLMLAEQELAGLPRPGATVPRAELEELRAKLRKRRGTARQLRAQNKQLVGLARGADRRADEAEAALAARASLPRRVVRRLRARRARRAAPPP